MSGKIFVCVRKLREKREIVLVSPENFLYVCETDYEILGKLFWYVREKHFKTSPRSPTIFGEILINDSRAN